MVDIEGAAAALIASQPDDGPSVDELAARWQRTVGRRRLGGAVIVAALVVVGVAVAVSSLGSGRTQVRVSSPGVSAAATTVPVAEGAPTGRCNISPSADEVVERTVTISHVRYYRFTDVGSAPCRLSDAPTLQLLDAKGHRLRTISEVSSGAAGPGRRHPVTLRPHVPLYVNLQILTRSEFPDPPRLVCPASSSLLMRFPGSRGSVLISGAAGRLAPYEQYGHDHLTCGLINILPLSRTPTDSVGA